MCRVVYSGMCRDGSVEQEGRVNRFGRLRDLTPYSFQEYLESSSVLRVVGLT